MKLVYSRLARDDLLSAQDWYSQRESTLGTRFAHAVAATAEQLGGFPRAAAGAIMSPVTADTPMKRSDFAGRASARRQTSGIRIRIVG